ncbi:hypothetical protein [Thermococcus sp. AM4]|uniref:hypothetical protein n=1 Tax=Thermococcus sp. (strain AM4) TaxID=246969 RepID=UPI00064F2E7F|nr:hypothetical protein [Thermococcus sp. AM4]
MIDVLNLSIFLFVLVIVGLGVILSGIMGLALTLIAWSSFILSLRYGTPIDIKVGYMSVLAWALAMGDVFIRRVFPTKKQLDLRGFLVFSYLPPVVLLLLLNGHESLGVVGLFVLMILNDDSMAKALPQSLFSENTVKILLILQVVVIGLSTLSPYLLSYVVILWWWYKLTVEK